MPGWVLPAVAAELWGVSVDQVMADVAAGRVSSRVEGEFVFVDVQPADDPHDTVADKAVTPPPYRRSLAWSVPTSDELANSIAADPIVTAEERDALMDEAEHLAASDGTWNDVESEESADAPDEPISLTADDIPNWGEVRSRVARTRKPPRRILDAA